MVAIQKILKSPPFLLLGVYILTRLINLTNLPIFNDEAIYLDWGWRELHEGDLYYSLYDNKQPLLMWIFGLSQMIFESSLWAGRIVSVVCGLISTVGIFAVSRLFLSQKMAIFSSSLYIVVPIFVLFDRLALMESAISAVGIWSFYFLYKLINEGHIKFAFYLGITLGIGFFIKSNAAIFILTSVFLTLLLKRKPKFFLAIAISILAIDFLLFLSPMYWSTLSKNSLYSLELSELIKFPLSIWIDNVLSVFEIGFIYITPFIFALGVVGIITIFRKKLNAMLICYYFLLNLFILCFISRSLTQRYIVSFLPFVVVFAAIAISYLLRSNKQKYIAMCFSLLIPVLFSASLIFNPSFYFLNLQKITKYAAPEYFTSGINVKEVGDYIETKSSGERTFVGMAVNTGNPESAMIVRYQKSDIIKTVYFDKILFGGGVNEISCVRSPIKFYFVSREEQQGGLNKFLVEEKRFHNKYNNTSIGIYRLKNEKCEGKTFDLLIKEK